MGPEVPEGSKLEDRSLELGVETRRRGAERCDGPGEESCRGHQALRRPLRGIGLDSRLDLSRQLENEGRMGASDALAVFVGELLTLEMDFLHVACSVVAAAEAVAAPRQGTLERPSPHVHVHVLPQIRLALKRPPARVAFPLALAASPSPDKGSSISIHNRTSANAGAIAGFGRRCGSRARPRPRASTAVRPLARWTSGRDGGGEGDIRLLSNQLLGIVTKYIGIGLLSTSASARTGDWARAPTETGWKLGARSGAWRRLQTIRQRRGRFIALARNAGTGLGCGLVVQQRDEGGPAAVVLSACGCYQDATSICSGGNFSPRVAGFVFQPSVWCHAAVRTAVCGGKSRRGGAATRMLNPWTIHLTCRQHLAVHVAHRPHSLVQHWRSRRVSASR